MKSLAIEMTSFCCCMESCTIQPINFNSVPTTKTKHNLHFESTELVEEGPVNYLQSNRVWSGEESGKEIYQFKCG